jgi:hypothetical protein
MTMPPDDDLRARAEHLRVLLAIHQGGDSLGVDGLKQALDAGLDTLSRNDLELMDDLTPEDHALAKACYQIEADMRRRGWDALERLAALLPKPDVSAALAELPIEQIAEVVSAMLELGWRKASSADDGPSVA